MTKATANPSRDVDSAGALNALFGLSEAGLDVLGEAFGHAAAAAGVDGAGVFDALRRGRTLGAALSLPPALVEALYARAHGWLKAGQPAKAAPLFRALVTLEPGDADYWVGFGCCVRQSNAREARLAFMTAARLRPDWGLPQFHLMALAMHLQDWDAAASALSAFRAAGNVGVPAEIQHEAKRLGDAILVRKEVAASHSGRRK